MKTNLPLVSIISPTYYRALLIPETLDSIITQTYKNWEHIIVDDGLSDNTVEIVQEYQSIASRITFFEGERCISNILQQ